ncbi:hypothetical protein MBLNU459_g8217t1 [Dothideomycetes sp. NU459]
MASIAPAGASQQRPNRTLYCSNLPDKLQKKDLKRALYMLFSVYGPILDIVALKTSRMRGQAHVVFRDVTASTQAMRALQGTEFVGKQMKISFATSKSDTLAKLDGTFKQPDPVTSAESASNQPSTLQQSIFSGPPGATGVALSATGPPPALKPPVLDGADAAPSPASQGTKRPREESDDEKEDGVPMDMDDEAMEESDDE